MRYFTDLYVTTCNEEGTCPMFGIWVSIWICENNNESEGENVELRESKGSLFSLLLFLSCT